MAEYLKIDDSSENGRQKLGERREMVDVDCG